MLTSQNIAKAVADMKVSYFKASWESQYPYLVMESMYEDGPQVRKCIGKFRTEEKAIQCLNSRNRQVQEEVQALLLSIASGRDTSFAGLRANSVSAMTLSSEEQRKTLEESLRKNLKTPSEVSKTKAKTKKSKSSPSPSPSAEQEPF